MFIVIIGFDNNSVTDIFMIRSLEVQVAMKSLQFVSLALKTCHVVIIVQDNLATSGELMALLQVMGQLFCVL